MWSIKWFYMFFLFSYLSYSETIDNIEFIEKTSEKFESEMDKGKNKASDVIKFIQKLKTIKKYDASSLIESLQYIDYSKFDKKKCLSYKKTLVARGANPAVELNNENLDTYLYHSLQILSKVCKNSKITDLSY